MANIDPSKVYAYFDSRFGLTKSSLGWFIFACPYCAELQPRKKMAVHPHHNCVKCWVCGMKKSVPQFVMDWEDISYPSAMHLLQDFKASKVTFEIETNNNYSDVEVVLPVGFTPLMMGDGTLGKRARAVLESRGFDLMELDMAGFGYCNAQAEDPKDDYMGYIIIPFYSYGNLVYFIARDFVGNYLRYKNPAKSKFGIGKADVWFNEDAFYIHDLVFCLEGALDAKTLGDNAVASCGWSWSKRQMRIVIDSPCTHICLVPDAGGERGVPFYIKALEIAHSLIEYKQVKILDLNKFGEKADANSLGKEVIMELFEKTPYSTFTDLVEIQLDYET